MGWNKKRTLYLQTNAIIRARNRKETIALASEIALEIGTVLLGIATIWLLSAQALQAFLQDTAH
ncbi:MAG TPA: hypothetical protein ACFYEA_01580 [Candidatus Tripitaka californicus]